MDRSGNKLVRALLKLFLAVLLVSDLYPFLWMLLSSVKKNSEFTKPMFALPEGFYFQNYLQAIEYANIGVLFKNTTIVTFVSIVLIWVFSSTAAFAVTKMRWRISEAMSLYLRIGMFIPSFVLLLPQFLMFQSMKVLNTLWALIIVFSTSISMSVYLLTGFYRYVPDEIMEASVIDGCGIYRCYFHIVMPMSLNGFVTVIMLSFVNVWNDLLISQTFVSSNTKKMLQVGLAAFLDAKGARDWGPTFAAICIAVFPTLLLYLILNKKIIEGLSAGAVKG